MQTPPLPGHLGSSPPLPLLAAHTAPARARVRAQLRLPRAPRCPVCPTGKSTAGLRPAGTDRPSPPPRRQATPSREPDLGAAPGRPHKAPHFRPGSASAPARHPATPAHAQPRAREGAAAPPPRPRPGAPARTHRAAAAAAWASVTSARRPGVGSAVVLGEGRAPRRAAPMRELSLKVPRCRRRLPGPRFQSLRSARPASPQPALPTDAARPPSLRPHFRLARAAARARWARDWRAASRLGWWRARSRWRLRGARMEILPVAARRATQGGSVYPRAARAVGEGEKPERPTPDICVRLSE